MDDYRDFELFTLGQSMVARGMRRRKLGLVGMAMRLLLRAFKAGLWGLDQSVTGAELVARLNAAGFKVSTDDLKNAGRNRKPIPENSVPRTPDTLHLASVFHGVCPGFDQSRFFAPEAT